MYLCTLCHFDAEIDDVQLLLADGRCVCVRCYHRETGSARPMPKPLRRELQSVLAALAA